MDSSDPLHRGGKRLAILETVHYQPDPAKELDFITNLHVIPIEAPNFKEPTLALGTDANVSLKKCGSQFVLAQIKTIQLRECLSQSSTSATSLGSKHAKRMDRTSIRSKIDELNYAFTPDGSKLVLSNGEIWDVKSSQRLREALIQHPADNVVIREMERISID